MTQYAIVTDLNRCVGCLACSVACKALNGVLPGNFWNKTLRVGPNPKEGGSGQFPDVEMYFLTMQCQHCKDPECCKVCPTGASYKADDGTVQIDKEKCIGCQFCVMACPYGVRYLNEDEKVVEKCTLCQQRIVEGELPACVAQCGGMARFFGDLDKGIEDFEGPQQADLKRVRLQDFCNEYTQDQVYNVEDFGNGPQLRYILRDRKWQGAR
ncbi:MAG: 4Fe-4S dicluster domain-containing protein [Eggerthellaceae bacterium]|nr:4Fe-4S dicluster domain-containing protein [Eggerthellaceae bacterium]